MKKKPVFFLLLCLITLCSLAVPGYAAEPSCSIRLEAEKKIVGDKPVTDAVFCFVLEAMDGAPLPEQNTITVTGAGIGTFPSIPYTEPGDFHYTLQEKPGNAEGYTYDPTVYRVTVQVSADADGTLRAAVYLSVSDTQGKPANAVFVSQYRKPAETPQTGDVFHLIRWIALGSVSLIGLLWVGLLYRKKRCRKRSDR